MRMNGGYSLHQSLTTETAAVVKQAISLARRRGHAQVTPLHVAIAMLSWSGSFKRACLQSRSHPLQSKALDLCFNVALNRLPTSSSPLLGLHSNLPSLSNALVAAFKRAQAHQRRGSMENGQQQPVPALKVEVHQLVISILYDPSVSRVMREAGFSSAHVRNNVEQSEKRNVSINSTDTVSQKNVATITSLSQFRFPSLLCQQQKMINHSEHTNLALSLSLENSCVHEMHGERVDGCKWLIFNEKAAEMKKEKEEKSRLRSSAKLPPWLQQYKDESATQINVFNEPRKPELVSNPNSSPNSASSSEDDNYTKYNYDNKFKEIDSDYTDMEKKDDQEEEEEGNSGEMKKCGLLDLNMATEEEEEDDDGNSVCKEIGILDLVDQQNRIRNPGLTINVN